jgi:hypothetical protein
MTEKTATEELAAARKALRELGTFYVYHPSSIPAEHLRVNVARANFDKAQGGYLEVNWSVKGVGFGGLVMSFNEAGECTHIESETMSRDFVKRVLGALVDQAKECD